MLQVRQAIMNTSVREGMGIVRPTCIRLELIQVYWGMLQKRHIIILFIYINKDDWLCGGHVQNLIVT